MRKKNITETDLFRKVNIMITDDLKEKMEYEKERATLLSDVEIDNSTLVRAMIGYFYDNENAMKKLVPYLKKTKGHALLENLHEMMDKNVEAKTIEKQLGIGLDILKKIENRQKELNNSDV